MTVNIQNAEQGNSGSGWSWYALGKENDREHALLIHGDTQLGDAICESVSYKSGNYVRFVISFADEDNVTPEQGRVIAKEWFDEYMTGFGEDEYHLDLVEHQNTKQLHYHGRIAKVNLLTSTQLKPYYHKADLSYKIAVNEVIAEKHNLILGTDLQRLVLPPQEKEKRIAKWRKEHSQEPYDLSSKKGRAVAEEEIADFINDLNMQGLVNSLDDVKAELTAMDFTIPNEGYDKNKGFHYITIQRGENKLRLKGDTYGERFYEHSREDRSKAIGDNRSLEARRGSNKRSRAEVVEALRKERSKRLKWIYKQYGGARERAVQRIQEEQRFVRKEFNKDEEDTPDVSSPFYFIDGHNHRNISNVSYKRINWNMDTIGESSRQDSNTERTQLACTGQYNHEQRRVKDDSVRAKTIGRIRHIRARARIRAEAYDELIGGVREQHKRLVENFDSQVSAEFNRSYTKREQGARELNSLLAHAYSAKQTDYRAIKAATDKRAVRRGTSANFTTSVSIIRRSIGQFIGQIKQEFDRRTKNLIVGVVNVSKKKQLFERGKKKVMSQLRDKKITLTARR